MGQYHNAVNLDKREYLDPHAMGLGLKQWEQVSNRMALALIAMLSCSNGRGGGDLPEVDGINGRWAGDRIAFVGDYTEPGDIEGYDGIERVYGLCGASEDDINELDEDGHRFYPEGTQPFTDITPLIVNFIEEAEDGIFVGTGWRQWISNNGRVARWSDEPGSREKIHGTIVAMNRDTRNFTIQWDGGACTTYNGADDRQSLPYLMSSDEPAPRLVPDMVLTS